MISGLVALLMVILLAVSMLNAQGSSEASPSVASPQPVAASKASLREASNQVSQSVDLPSTIKSTVTILK